MPKTKKFNVLVKGKTKSLSNFKKQKSIEKDWENQTKLLSALEEVSKVLTVEVDLHKILEDMAGIIAKTIGAKWVNFWELTPDKKSLYITAAYGMKPEYLTQSKEHPIRLGTAWIGRAVKTKRAWATNDILTDPKLMKDLGITWKKAVKEQDYRALLCIPTISRRGPVGGICVYYPKVHEFTDFEMRLVTIAANQAATSITNAQIFEELLAEKQKVLAMLNSLHDGLIVYDLDGKITDFNRRSEELLWIKKADLFGRKTNDLPIKTNPLLKNIQSISYLNLTERESRELSIEKPYKLTLQVTNLPLKDYQDKKIGKMIILHDITAEKEVEELKTSFVSIAAHQLRTPLTAIKWSLTALLEDDRDSLCEKKKEIAQKSFHVNENLIKLVNELLDVSKIEEGKYDYQFKKIDLQKLIEKAVNGLTPNLKTKEKVSLFFKKRKETFQVNADPDKLKIAISNIIDNAIIYTPEGSINISIERERKNIVLIIRDTGIGIPENQKKFVFQRFFRAKNAILTQTEGSGLGLWIANEIIKKHNGRISFESKKNKGSVFYIQLPTDIELMPKIKTKKL